MSNWRERAERLRRVDRIIFAANPGDAVVSCPAALHAGYRADQRTLVVTVFTETGIRDLPAAALADTRLRSQLARMVQAEAAYEQRRQAEIEAARRGGYHPFLVGLTDAPFRHDDGRYNDFSACTWGSSDDDATTLREVAELMVILLSVCRPWEVLIPLGVGRHINRRLLFEAHRLVMATPEGGARAAGDGPELLWYEDRPWSLVDQATKMRLRELGYPVQLDPQRFFTALWEADYARAALPAPGPRVPFAARYMESIARPELTAEAPRGRTLACDDLDALWRMISPFDTHLTAFPNRAALGRVGRTEAKKRSSEAAWVDRQWSLPRLSVPG